MVALVPHSDRQCAWAMRGARPAGLEPLQGEPDATKSPGRPPEAPGAGAVHARIDYAANIARLAESKHQ
jgi:hypothetical protein